MIYKAKNQVRMHDTDMAGILYFPRQFRFIHDALEDLMESEDLWFDQLFTQHNFAFVVVHAESDYYSSLKVGDKLEIHVHVGHIGTTSFTMEYKIFKLDGSLVGRGQTVHVTIDRESRTKIPIPDILKSGLIKYLVKD